MESLPPGHIMMSNWNIVVIEYHDVTVEKFLGYSHQSNKFRISSQVLKYDPETNTGSTVSGSKYSFLDKPGRLHPAAQFIFNKLQATKDVSVSLKFNVDE